jgi:copper(I)-binding protein
VIRSRAAVALAVSLVAVLPTAGCYQGFDNTVNTQGPTGNGTDFLVGDGIKVQDATLVTGPEGESGVASLVMSIINEGEQPDALVKVTTEPATTSSQKTPIAIRPGTSVRVGGPAADQIVLTGLKVTPGSYATVTVSFERAGSETRKVAVVPAVGYYEGYGPVAAVAK